MDNSWETSNEGNVIFLVSQKKCIEHFANRKDGAMKHSSHDMRTSYIKKCMNPSYMALKKALCRRQPDYFLSIFF
jgi:hypothetical protein